MGERILLSGTGTLPMSVINHEFTVAEEQKAMKYTFYYCNRKYLIKRSGNDYAVEGVKNDKKTDSNGVVGVD